ncbi:sodium-independent sulfate anion transporter-like isoform X3 [Artemia franciscana]|uniref:sodium-independent sulfate anion transporter-like isoform X3 n=1 Tax=Artemia franciscana TaxID=6661 RepID=UPI0032DAF15D
MDSFHEELPKGDDTKKSFWQKKIGKIFCKKTLYSRLPFLEWLPKIRIASLVSDLIAGLSVGLTLVPQSLAYATIAGLPPQYGLYSSIMGGFMYAIFGGTTSMSVAPVSLLAITIYPVVTKFGPEVAVFLCFASGIIEMALGLFNLGFLLDFISPAVIDGFTSAAALIISSTQLKSLFGLSYKSEGFLNTLIQFFTHVKEYRMADTIMGVACLIFLFSMRALGRLKLPGDSAVTKIVSKLVWFLSIGRNAICVFLCAGIAVNTYDPLSEDTFNLIGNITSGLPSFSPPPLQTTNVTSGNKILEFWELATETGFLMIMVSLLAILEALAIAKSFSDGKKSVDASQEIIAIGASNIVGSFLSSFPVTGAFSRTAVNKASGVQTPISGVITKSDLIPFGTTFFAGLFFGLDLGIIVGTVVHILIMSFAKARPTIEIKATHKEDGTIILVMPRESLVFPAADYFINLVKKAISKEEKVTTVIFDLAFVNRLDFATAKSLKCLSDDFGGSGAEVIAINVMPKILTVLQGIQSKKMNVANC